MTIQQLTAGRELIDEISEREIQIAKIREYMKAYIDNSSDDEFNLTISSKSRYVTHGAFNYVHGDYVGSFSAEDIRTLLNDRIAKVEEEIKELKKEFESL